MIKIITRGHPLYKMTCEYCNCVFTFEDGDIRGSSATKYSVNCPDCKMVASFLDKTKYVITRGQEEIPE